MPYWLHDLSFACILVGALCALLVTADLTRRPQPMWIMNLVWPLTALFGMVAVVWLYYTRGRAPVGQDPPFPIAVAKGTLHCGAGCALGDIIAEWLILAFPTVALAFGWHRLFDQQLFAVWILDYLCAYALGIVFQYFAIAPMRSLPVGRGLVAAVKADTLSLTAWQIGMYGFMALAHFYLFGRLLGKELQAGTAEFWFMMQLAMLCGFATAYPVNWWLIRLGVKETM